MDTSDPGNVTDRPLTPGTSKICDPKPLALRLGPMLRVVNAMEAKFRDEILGVKNSRHPTQIFQLRFFVNFPQRLKSFSIAETKDGAVPRGRVATISRSGVDRQKRLD